MLDEPGPWDRILGIRANASTKSHAELDEAEELDDGDPADLAGRYLEIGERLPHLTVLGGCCGTDHRHVASIADAWFAQPPAAPRKRAAIRSATRTCSVSSRRNRAGSSPMYASHRSCPAEYVMT